MDIKDISTQLLYTTVPIFMKNKDGSQSSGTGFIYSIDENDNISIPLLITNFHVVENVKYGYLDLHVAEKSLPTKETIRVQFDRTVINNKLGDLDLVAIPIASTLNTLQEKNIVPFFRTVGPKMIPSQIQMENLAAIEDVTFIGYPNALYDDVNKMSIVRQGTTATPIWNNFRGSEIFLIDAGVFPGSSGSPVFIYNRGTYPTSDGIAVGSRLLFVGILSQTLQKRGNNKNLDYLDLGIVINSRAFEREVNVFIQKIKNM